jgi:hypothetical protein
MTAFIGNPKNYKCLETYAKVCKIFGATNETVKNQIASTLDQVCNYIVPKLMKPATSNVANPRLDFVLRLDTDVATAFANLITQVIELNAEAFACCTNLEIVVQFFCDSLSYVIEPEFNKQTISMFMQLIEAVPKRMSEQS